MPVIDPGSADEPAIVSSLLDVNIVWIASELGVNTHCDATRST
jgi:hypothetical protein